MPRSQPEITIAPPPTPYPMPSSPPPYQTPPYSLPRSLPGYVVDKLMPQVPFYYRPLALKIAIGLIIAGTVLCLGFVMLLSIGPFYSTLQLLIFSFFLIIGVLGIISIILLMIPKRIGWYIAIVTAILGLFGLGPGTLISIFALIALNWPSTLYFFRTGQPMLQQMFPYSYPYPYSYPPYPNPYPYPYPMGYMDSPAAGHPGESLKPSEKK